MHLFIKYGSIEAHICYVYDVHVRAKAQQAKPIYLSAPP